MEKETYKISEYFLTRYCRRRLSEPDPVKLFVGLILSQKIDLKVLKPELIDHFGQIDIESLIHPFNHTDYYVKEMGPNLKRCFLGFVNPVSPDNLAEIKLATNRIEIQTGRIAGEMVYRRVNIDPGILSLSNVILATTKNRSHRIYLSKGIYAEITLIYSKNLGWQHLDWTYPDYRTPITFEFFSEMRERHYQQIRDKLRKSCSRNLDKISP